MTDYQKYINALRKCAKEHENDRTSTGHIIISDLCRDTANLLETVDQEPRKGHWINNKCTNCRYEVLPWNNTPYCPNCGAKMVESQESEG